MAGLDCSDTSSDRVAGQLSKVNLAIRIEVVVVCQSVGRDIRLDK